MRLTVLLVALATSFSAPAWAVKYLALGDAVKTFIPEGAKIVKVTKQLSAEQKQRLKTDYGWEAKEPEYVFYVGKKDDQATSYVFVVPEAFNTCFHKYAVGMRPNGEIIDTVIIELSCPRSFPINSAGFLSQFKAKKHEDPLTINADIDAVSSATLSSQSTATAARKAVSLHNLFFGGAKPVLVAEAIKKARNSGEELIQTAIETGETMGGAGQLPEGKKK